MYKYLNVFYKYLKHTDCKINDKYTKAINPLKLIIYKVCMLNFYKGGGFVNNKNTINTKEEQEDRFEDYLKTFDKNFKTEMNGRFKNMPLLIEIFREYIQNYSTIGKTYKNNMKMKNALIKELTKTLDKNQNDLFEKINFCSLTMNDELVEQAFIYGFTTAAEFKFEAEKEIKHCQKTRQSTNTKITDENSRQNQ